MNNVLHVYPELVLQENVAIVGASATLLGSNFGKIIDSYDEVIRFNRSPTEGYESDVGSKTTLRVVNNHVFNNNDISSDGYSNSPKNFVRNLRNCNILYIGPDYGPWHNRNENTHHSNSLFIFDYSKINLLKNKYEYVSEKNPQIGTILTLLGVDSSLKITLFGFDLTPSPRTHYYEERPANVGSCHDLSKDQNVIISLEKNNLINVKK
jgi:hypothetical protein